MTETATVSTITMAVAAERPAEEGDERHDGRRRR